MTFPKDPLRHTLVVGKTGTGKSTLLAKVAADFIEADWGLCLVDPHGDLAQDVLTIVPRRRRNDLVVVDAARDDCPGLNPLIVFPGQQPSLAVSSLIATMRKVWPDNWGPRTEHILRHAFSALVQVRGATLEDATRMLVDDRHRRWVVRQVDDEIVSRFWNEEFPGYGARLMAEATAPVLNKLGALLGSPAIRAFVTKTRPKLDIARALERGRIIVVSVPKGRIGEDAARLIGSLILGAVQHAVLARSNVSRDDRRPMLLVVDEATSFAVEPLLELTAEARKFGLGLVLATQSVSALEPATRFALLGNVGTLVCFQTGAEDADIFTKEFADDFGIRVLTRLGVGEMVVRSGSGAPVLVNKHGTWNPPAH